MTTIKNKTHSEDLSSISDERLTEIIRSIAQEGILIFPGQKFHDRTLADFASRIGKLEASSRKICVSPIDENISYLSNLRDYNGEFLGFPGSDRDFWHSDQQHRENPAP